MMKFQCSCTTIVTAYAATERCFVCCEFPMFTRLVGPNLRHPLRSIFFIPLSVIRFSLFYVLVGHNSAPTALKLLYNTGLPLLGAFFRQQKSATTGFALSPF